MKKVLCPRALVSHVGDKITGGCEATVRRFSLGSLILPLSLFYAPMTKVGGH